MKHSTSTSLKALLATALAVAFSPYVAGAKLDSTGKPQTIGKVLEFLDKLLSKSQAEGEAEATIFAKFKCYCDDNEKSKSSEVKELTDAISKLGSEIEGLQAANGELSSQSTKLKTDIASNLASQKEANNIRSKASKDFEAEKADLTTAMGQMSAAIKMLSDVGADQTQSSRKKKSASFLGLGADVQQALEAASALVPLEKRSTVQAFMQAPFTGSYTSQSASILGLLKNLRDTFASNLESASAAEESDFKAHAALMSNFVGLEQEMKKAYAEKQQELGENDSELGAKRLQLNSAAKSNDSAEEFLSKLLPTCETKTKEYDARKELRVNEEAAISQALSTLGSDSALKAFAQTSDSEGVFLQLRATRRHPIGQIQLEVQKVLAQAQARLEGSSAEGLTRLGKILQANNPFSVVFAKIEKMEELIDKEQDADEEKHAFCKKQTDGGKDKLKKTNDEIDSIEEATDKLDETVNKPQTGLKAQDDALEKAMEENLDNQKKETTMRQNENVQYQKNVAQLDKAEELLGKAIGILKKFYSSLDDKSGVAASALVQQEADPNPPKTWSGSYTGQTDAAQGEKGAIGMIKFILAETKKQNAAAQKAESDAQADFEDSMGELIKAKTDMEKNMVKLKTALAEAEQEMIAKDQDLKQANKDKTATEAYIADIKPGCDFMFDNFELRTKNRKLETESLVQARTLMKKSPAYQAASAEAEAEALGACKPKCGAPEHVKCKACLAHVSIPGYCAGHRGTPGC